MATKAEDKTEDKGAEAPTSASSGAQNVSSLPEGQRPPGDIRRRVRKERRKGPFIKYVGSAAQRDISPSEWRMLHIELKDDKATHVWNIANDKMVEADKFNDAQLDYLLVDDLQQGTNAHAFLLMDYDGDGEDAQLVQAVYE